MSTNDSLARTILVVAVVVLLVPFLVMSLAMPMMGLWGGGHMWGGPMWDGGAVGGTTPWMLLLMWLPLLLLVLGLGALAYWSLRRSGGRESDAAIAELRMAYARGELSDEEFEDRRDRLRRDS